MLKHMNSLRWTSVAALSTVIYLTCLVVGHYISNGIQVDGDLFPIEYWRWELDVFTALPIVIFAFTCHQNVSIYLEKKFFFFILLFSRYITLLKLE